MANPKRVYVPAHGGLYFIEAPYVQHQNGERSRSAVNGQPQHKDSIWAKEQEQKGLLVIDYDLKAEDCYTMAVTGVQPSGQKGVEYGQIRATIKGAADEDSKYTLGLGSQLPANLPGAFHTQGAATISGTYGENTLNAIGDLARLNTIGITRIHHEANNEEVYAISPVMTTVTSVNGSSINPLNFPQSDSDDENTSVRDMTPEYLKSQGFEGGLRFNGMNYLTYSLLKGQSITLTFYTVFTPK